MEPIMRLLIAAEEGRTLRKGERLSVDSELLAKELKVKWYVGEAIPDDLRPERSKVRELVRIKRDRYAMTYRDKEGQEYAIVGKIKDLDDLGRGDGRYCAGMCRGEPDRGGIVGLLVEPSAGLAACRANRQGQPGRSTG